MNKILLIQGLVFILLGFLLSLLQGCAWMSPSNCPFCDKDDPRPHLFHTKCNFIVTKDGLAQKDITEDVEAYQKRKAKEDGHPELWKKY